MFNVKHVAGKLYIAERSILKVLKILLGGVWMCVYR